MCVCACAPWLLCVRQRTNLLKFSLSTTWVQRINFRPPVLQHLYLRSHLAGPRGHFAFISRYSLHEVTTFILHAARFLPSLPLSSSFLFTSFPFSLSSSHTYLPRACNALSTVLCTGVRRRHKMKRQVEIQERGRLTGLCWRHLRGESRATREWMIKGETSLKSDFWRWSLKNRQGISHPEVWCRYMEAGARD